MECNVYRKDYKLSVNWQGRRNEWIIFHRDSLNSDSNFTIKLLQSTFHLTKGSLLDWTDCPGMSLTLNPLSWIDCVNDKSSCTAKIGSPHSISVRGKLTKFKTPSRRLGGVYWGHAKLAMRQLDSKGLWHIDLPLLRIDDHPFPLWPVTTVSIMRTSTLISTIMSDQTSNTD